MLLRQAGPDGTGLVTFTPTPMADRPGKGSHLSLAAKVGIGVTIGVVLIVIAILALFYRSRKKSSPSRAQEFGKPELEDTSKTSKAYLSSPGRYGTDGTIPVELDAPERFEAVDGQIHELSPNEERHEVEVREIYELPGGEKELVQFDKSLQKT